MRKIAIVISAFLLISMLTACVNSHTPDVGYDSSGGPEESQQAVSTTTNAESTKKTVTTIPTDKLISKSEAKTVALEKADVKESDISRLEIDLDYDNDQKRWEYEVDFYVGKVEYELDIDAKSGEVVLFKKDDNTVTKQTKPTTKETAKATTVSTAASKLISKDTAKKAALNRAGVKSSEVSHYRIKTDFDDDRNRWEYEIDFYVGKVEYDVTVDAVTGKVLAFEREDEEDKRQATATTKPTFITKEEVKSLALLCAGVNESKISQYELELDYDDDTKRWEYEATFKVGRIEYDVLIDAVTGELIHYDKEIDD